jgi:hypothetical protein
MSSLGKQYGVAETEAVLQGLRAKSQEHWGLLPHRNPENTYSFEAP